MQFLYLPCIVVLEYYPTVTRKRECHTKTFIFSYYVNSPKNILLEGC